MKTSLLITIIFLFLAFGISAQTNFPSYYEQNKFNLASPGALKYGLYGYDNPAMLALQPSMDLYVTWNSNNNSPDNYNNWGFFAAVPYLGFSMVNNTVAQRNFNDFKISTGFGGSALGIGAGIGWAAGDLYNVNRSTYYSAGMYFRPLQYLSIGIIGNFPVEGNGEGVLDLAVRPLGNEIVTLFGDYLYRNNMYAEENKWSAGLIIEAIDGLRVSGRYFENEIFNVGAHLSFGNLGVTAQTNFANEGDESYQTYGIRIGTYDRTFMSALSKRTEYVEFDMKGTVKYQKYKFFDDSKTLIEILDQIEAAKTDPSVYGIVMNLSGMQVNREMIWEIREKLKEFKSANKKVVVYFDYADITEMYFASVADKIIIDPMGSIEMSGIIKGRQYYKGTLEKIGIGFTELRYFKYKSAAETFANDKMSEADREQYQKLVDENYELFRQGISEERNISLTNFDSMIDNEYFILPAKAVELGLADTLARWDDVENIIESTMGNKKNFVDPESLVEFKLPEDDYWGKKPEIAVIYAIGVCAMDEGIKARTLVKYVEDAVEEKNIRAIILRVDSPGGEALPSDLIAEALKKAKGKKPVIVSQGSVAASGGYWLSMYGDKILSSPLTLTGSIGVIGAFFYNKSFKEELGVSTDYVKRGKHAELGYGMRFPLFGLTIPDRNYSDDELLKVESIIKTLYGDFVSRVAAGRNMSVDDIEKIAQGRVWSGTDALENGLVDELGGLSSAISLAVEEAGLKNKKYDVVQYPPAEWFNFESFVPQMFGISEFNFDNDPFINSLKFRLKNNGYPIPILPMSEMDLLEE